MEITKDFLITTLLATLIVAGSTGQGQSATYPEPVGAKTTTSDLLHRIRAKKCIRLLSGRTGDRLANSCNSCRKVNLSRSRPGNAAPVNRNYTIPGDTITDLPFRGPGHTRLLSESTCNTRASREAVKRQSGGKECAQLYRPKSSKDLAILNTCLLCRSVVAEREDARGRKKRQMFSIAGKSFVPLQPKGAVRVRIISDKSCQ